MTKLKIEINKVLGVTADGEIIAAQYAFNDTMADKILMQLIESNPVAALAYIKELRTQLKLKNKTLHQKLDHLLSVIPGDHAGLELMAAIAKYMGEK